MFDKNGLIFGYDKDLIFAVVNFYVYNNKDYNKIAWFPVSGEYSIKDNQAFFITKEFGGDLHFAEEINEELLDTIESIKNKELFYKTFVVIEQSDEEFIYIVNQFCEINDEDEMYNDLETELIRLFLKFHKINRKHQLKYFIDYAFENYVPKNSEEDFNESTEGIE